MMIPPPFLAVTVPSGSVVVVAVVAAAAVVVAVAVVAVVGCVRPVVQRARGAMTLVVSCFRHVGVFLVVVVLVVVVVDDDDTDDDDCCWNDPLYCRLVLAKFVCLIVVVVVGW